MIAVKTRKDPVTCQHTNAAAHHAAVHLLTDTIGAQVQLQVSDLFKNIITFNGAFGFETLS